MIGVAGVGEKTAGELALWLSVLRGTAAYVAYLASAPDLDAALEELEDELRALVSDAAVVRISPRTAEHLVAELAATSVEIVVVDARTFSAHDWALIDRRRSTIAHRGVLVFVTTPTSFDDLMRQTPNVASWLGGEVFAYPNDDTVVAAHRERRLVALRVWASKSDAEVVEAARQGTLPRDPEYAEWLVLLGYGELLGSGSS
jgi:hypothetical protein